MLKPAAASCPPGKTSANRTPRQDDQRANKGSRGQARPRDYRTQGGRKPLHGRGGGPSSKKRTRVPHWQDLSHCGWGQGDFNVNPEGQEAEAGPSRPECPAQAVAITQAASWPRLDSEGIRTPAGRAQWISSPSP